MNMLRIMCHAGTLRCSGFVKLALSRAMWRSVSSSRRPALTGTTSTMRSPAMAGYSSGSAALHAASCASSAAFSCGSLRSYSHATRSLIRLSARCNKTAVFGPPLSHGQILVAEA